MVVVVVDAYRVRKKRERVTLGFPERCVLPPRAHCWEGPRALRPRANLRGLDPRSARGARPRRPEPPLACQAVHAAAGSPAHERAGGEGRPSRWRLGQPRNILGPLQWI